MTANASSKSAQAAPEALQPIAVARSYGDIRAAIAGWCTAQRITRIELDGRAGLAEGHANKLLTPKAVKRFGSLTFGPVLNATGLALIVVEDNEALALIEQQLHACSGACEQKPRHWRRDRGSAWGRRMAGKRALKLTAEQRSNIARKAAHARWHRQPSLPTPGRDPAE